MQSLQRPLQVISNNQMLMPSVLTMLTLIFLMLHLLSSFFQVDPLFFGNSNFLLFLINWKNYL